MKKRKNDLQKGAISVFLTIILIPCIVISGMFVDLSRVKLSQGVATSSADLALNSLMANYDKDLSDYYGLMASCQNIEDFYEESAQFFLEALYSQGLSADDAESLLTYVSTLVNNETIHDLFQMEIQTETKDIVSGYKGGNSTEASLGTSSVIMKDQIVEFMKYRAPIGISSKIIQRLKDTGAKNIFDNAKEDEKLVEDKREYADAEEDFMDAAFKTYKALLEYENKKMSVTKLKKYLSDMKSARETYREVSSKMVSNLNGTSNLTQFYRPTYRIDTYSYDKKSNKIYSRKEKDDSGNDIYYIDGSKITSLLNDLENRITDFKNKRKAVSDAAGDTFVNASIGSSANQYNPIQWWKKVNSLVNTGSNSPIEKFKSSATSMLDSYAKVLAIKKCTIGDDIPTDWETRFNSLTQSVKDLQRDYLTAGVAEGSTNNKYLRLVNKLEKYSRENINKINPDKVTISNGKTVSNAIKNVDTLLSGDVTELTECIKTLDKLIDGGALLINPYSLNALGDKAEKYHSSYNTWKNNAKVQDTAMAKIDWDDIVKIESEPDPKKQQIISIGKQDVLNFKTRLVNIRDRLKDVKSTIESMKFSDKKLVNIDSYNTAYNAIKNKIGENLTNSAVSSKAASIFQETFTPYSADKNSEVKTYNFEDAKYNPVLTNDIPKFYNWLKTKFDKTDDSKVQEERDRVHGKESDGTKEGDNAKEKVRSDSVSQTNLYNNGNYAGADFPSGLDANGQFKLGSGLITSLGNIISSLVNMKFDGIRDSLYSTEYVMDMFSYATYENEGKYNLYKEKNGKPPTSTDDYSSENDAWNSSKITDTYNQTLTNKKINSTNNILFGAEVEYVLYGKENKDNVKSAYIDIFEIRYLLNTLSGFQNFWVAKDGNTTAQAIKLIADGVFAATSGIVPVSITKCVAILLLTAFETGKDLDRLQDGFPVEIYKELDDWWYTLDKRFSAKPDTKTNNDKGLFYSDYIYMFLYLGFESDSSASEMYRRIGDLIQVNMRKDTGKNTYMLKNARSYFELNAKIRVKPLMLALPIAQGYSNNPKDKNDWCTFEIHEIRGYS
ncbi:MAG: DUF5702 domain-containing protein [Clostridia bacterium]|nr:DUF5702 domain-containing protein [Clostridia bacterium]